jgi:RNA-directed DNA polymerase
MRRESHVRFCESVGVKLPHATHLICHCRSEEQARNLNASLEQRFAECGLTLHPEKTKIVYCKDDDRRGTYRDHKFDFLGYSVLQRHIERRATRKGKQCRKAA